MGLFQDVASTRYTQSVEQSARKPVRTMPTGTDHVSKSVFQGASANLDTSKVLVVTVFQGMLVLLVRIV